MLFFVIGSAESIDVKDGMSLIYMLIRLGLAEMVCYQIMSRLCFFCFHRSGGTYISAGQRRSLPLTVHRQTSLKGLRFGESLVNADTHSFVCNHHYYLWIFIILSVFPGS